MSKTCLGKWNENRNNPRTCSSEPVNLEWNMRQHWVFWTARSPSNRQAPWSTAEVTQIDTQHKSPQHYPSSICSNPPSTPASTRRYIKIERKDNFRDHKAAKCVSAVTWIYYLSWISIKMTKWKLSLSPEQFSRLPSSVLLYSLSVIEIWCRSGAQGCISIFTQSIEIIKTP